MLFPWLLFLIFLARSYIFYYNNYNIDRYLNKTQEEETMYQFGEFSKQTLEQLSGKGVFFTVKSGNKINTMTIGWGSLSQYWGEEIFIAPIRPSRYTFELLKNTDEFTVSVPAQGQMDEALKICGSRSGRDTDKLAAAGLSLKAAKEITTPVIDGCNIYYECKIVYSADLIKDGLPEEDLHRLFFGRIIACYQ